MNPSVCYKNSKLAQWKLSPDTDNSLSIRNIGFAKCQHGLIGGVSNGQNDLLGEKSIRGVCLQLAALLYSLLVPAAMTSIV